VGGTRLTVETENTQSQKNAQKTRRVPTCPLHPGMIAKSFSTKERLVATIRVSEKWRFFKKKAHFSRFLGDVLRTLCWATS
jgi:hypothetical protein